MALADLTASSHISCFIFKSDSCSVDYTLLRAFTASVQRVSWAPRVYPRWTSTLSFR